MRLVLSSYVPAVGRAKTDLSLHRPRLSVSGLLLFLFYFTLRRCEWCRERCGRDGCEERVSALATWEAGTPPAERLRTLDWEPHLFTPGEAEEVRRLAEAEPEPAPEIPRQRKSSPYPMQAVGA